VRLTPLLGLALLATLPGCSFVGDVAGVVAAGVTGSSTANPALAIAAGIGVRSGVDAVSDYVTRQRHESEQDQIAEVAGSAPLGEARYWEIRHTIPFGNEHGQLAAVREFQTPLTTCREILFTVEDGERETYTTNLCRGVARWSWAGAEPAVDRWGFMQQGGY